MHKFQRLLFGFEQCRITNQNHQQPWKRLQKEPRKSLRDMDLDEVSIWFHIQVSLGSPKLCEGCDNPGRRRHWHSQTRFKCLSHTLTFLWDCVLWVFFFFGIHVFSSQSYEKVFSGIMVLP
jgi:hypothetical protein